MIKLFVWKDNLSVAKALIDIAEKTPEPGLKEGFYRTAISKSYYACLMTLKEKNTERNIKSKKGGQDSHTAIIDCILEYNDFSEKRKEINKISITMRRLKKERTRSDYELGSSTYNNKFVLRHYQTCEEIFDLINTF